MLPNTNINNMSVIIIRSVILFKASREDEESDKYLDILKENSFKVVSIKTLDFKYSNLDRLKRLLAQPEKFNGIVFSSPRCIYGTRNALEDLDLDKMWTHKFNYAVGQTTYDLADKCLGLKCHGKESGNAKSLSDVIIQNIHQYNLSLPFLYPHGNLKMDILKPILACKNIFLEEVCVYESITNSNLECDFRMITNNYENLPEFMVFFSPSAFNAALPALQNIEQIILNDIKFVPIGPTTEEAIIRHNFTIYGVPKRPTPGDVLDVIINS